MSKVIVAIDKLNVLIDLIVNAVHKRHSPNDIVGIINDIKSSLKPVIDDEPEPEEAEKELAETEEQQSNDA